MEVWLEDDSELNPTKHYLLFPDEGGEVAAKIAQFLPNWMSPTPSGAFFNRRVTSKFCEPVQPLVIAGDLPEPPLGLNQLYIPLGAHRYSKMYALMYGEPGWPKNKGWNVFYNAGNYYSDPKKYATLKWFDAKKGRGGRYKGFFISRMIKLGENSLSSPEESVGAYAHSQYVALVELVDYRYHWQTAIMPYIADNNDMSQLGWDWQSLGLYLDDALQVYVNNKIGSFGSGYEKFADFYNLLGYHPGQPDRQYLNRPGESAAIVAEAALRSFCQTYYPTPELELNWLQLTSDDVFAGFLQESLVKGKSSDGIEVHFQRQVNGKVLQNKRPYIVSFQSGNIFSTSRRRVVHSSAIADMPFLDSVTPTNYNALYEIASEINDFAQENDLAVGVWQRTQERPKYFKLASLFNSDLHDYAFLDFAAGGVFSREAIRPIATQIVSYAVDKQFEKHCEETIRVQLLEDLPVCSNASAFQMRDEQSEDCPCDHYRQVLVIDTAGIARTRISNGERYAPAQSMGFAKQLRCGDSGEPDVYELISVGQGCCPPPGTSEYEDCCQQWFTRFEDLQTVSSKQVGDVVSYGETIGTSKSDGFRYKAFLSNSLSGDGCAIDVSGIHSYSIKNSRSSGTSPCTPSATECAINYARLKMAGKKPFDDSLCQDAFEDLSDAGTGDNYYRRKIVGRPETCITGKKLYNFTAARTTVLTKGADYIVLKHECEPASSSSSDGVDSCCVVMTDYDLQCISGKLQKFQRQTEVCWDGDCLVTKSVLPWTYTGQQVGCCDCAAGSGESSGVVASSGSSEGGTVLTSCCPDNPVPESLTVVISGGACAGTYSMTYNAGLNEWISGNFDGLLRMTCESFGWYLNLNMEGYSPVTVNCNPFSLTFTVIGDPICGNFTMTITG